jgi:large repetitive protein
VFTSAGPAQISVAIGTPASTNMIGGATQTFTASVLNDASNAGVTWAASAGTITASGVYTAPAPVKVAQATVTATSKSDPSKTASTIINLMSIAVTIGPANLATMASGASQALTATVTNDGSSAGVTWTVSGGGTFSAGSSSSGAAVTYTAPSPVSTFTATVNATSVTDPSKTQAVTITLAQISLNPISPVSASLGTGGSQVFTDSVANDPSNSGVTWSITPVLGTLSGASGTSVTYNAPTTVINAATPVTLTATSIKDPTKSTTANITLNRISVTIAPANPLAMLGGATQAFTATVANDGTGAGVTWTVSGGGSFSPISTLSGATTTYTAASPVGATSATLTATSKTDTTKSASVTVTLTPIAISLTSASAIALDGNGAQTLAVSASITGDASGSGATFVLTGAGGTMSPSPVSGNSPSATYTVPVVSAQTIATITVASVKDPARSQLVTVTLNPPMSFTTPPGALTAASVGTAYPGATIVVAGGTGSKTFTLATGALPAGLALSSTGVITGTATGALATSSFTVQVVDQSATPTTLSGTFNITVGTGPPVWMSPTAGTQTFVVGTAISPIALSTSGGAGAIAYTVNSGTLPQGLQIVGNQIAGTPTAPTAVAGNPVTFLATDSAKPTAATALSSSVTFIANPVTLAITSTALTGAIAAAPYSDQLTSTGGTGTIAWTLTAGSLTGTGLTLSNAGLISGTPTAARNPLSLTFQAQDSATNQQQTQTVTLSLSIAGPLVVTTASSLPTAPANAAYSQTLAAAGGSGSGYTWTVISVPNSLATLNLSLSVAGVITGTPTIAGTANFTVQVKDSANATATGTFSVSTAPALSLPAPNPTSLGAGTITVPYAGTITALGGIPGYAWTVNGNTVPVNGTPVSLVDSLIVTNSGGGATLSVSGTPTQTGTVSFTASVTDSKGTTSGPITYTIAVGNFYTVGGQINSQVGCNTSGLVGVTVSIDTTPVQTTTTSANGSFSFINVPNGTYIITPSISGSSSAFYPATETVVVNSNNLSAASFTATLGYTVSGTVAYTGTQLGQIYLALNPTGNCGGRSPGTSLSATGAYSIRGVPPGNYTLQAFMDTVGDGVPNAANPTGSTLGVSPTTANISGVAVTLSDPATVILTTAPTLTSVSPFNTGVFVQYRPITNGVGLEMATYYMLEWSTSPTFATLDGTKRFFPNGTHSNVWLLRGLTNGSVYYFRAYGTSGGTSSGPFSQIVGPILITAPTVGNVVTGSVSFAATPTGPLYVGYYDQGSGAFYGQYVVSPVSAQPFTIQVPTGSDYVLLGVLDQNNDGAIGENDITNTGNGSSTPVTAILGATANQSLTLPSADGIASVTTQNLESVVGSVATQNYNINFTVNGLVKRPVAVSLVSGQNLITPVDIAICGGSGSTCGQGFQISFNLYGTSPAVGDTYVFNVTYSDGTLGTLNAAVTAVLNGFAANLAPSTGTGVSTTPAFSWTDPLSAAAYTYQFYLTDSNAKVIWQIPQTNAASNGFSSAITTIPWNVDPSGGGSLPSVPSLTLGTTYSWQILVQDGNGNSTATQVQYQP